MLLTLMFLKYTVRPFKGQHRKTPANDRSNVKPIEAKTHPTNSDPVKVSAASIEALLKNAIGSFLPTPLAVLLAMGIWHPSGPRRPREDETSREKRKKESFDWGTDSRASHVLKDRFEFGFYRVPQDRNQDV
jgi:hypothetical protein